MSRVKSASAVPPRGLGHVSRWVGSHLSSKARAVRLRVGNTRFGFLTKRTLTKAQFKMVVARGLMTRAADKLEMKLPQKLALGVHLVRKVNPLGVWGFCAHKFRQDPKFLMKYGLFSVSWSYLQPPALVYLGVSLPLAYSLTSSMVLPIDVGVILYRQHKLRKDPNQTLMGTVRGLGTEYTDFVDQRRFENRVFTYSWPRPKGI